MKVQTRSDRPGFALLARLGIIAALFASPGTFPAAWAQTGPITGATDPAGAYSEWPDHEIAIWPPGMTTSAKCPGSYNHFIIEAANNPPALAEEGCAGELYGAVAVTSGRVLTNARETMVYAYTVDSLKGYLYVKIQPRSADPKSPYPTVTLAAAALRVTGSMEFLDLASGDVDGNLADDGEYRDEVIVAFALPDASNLLPISLNVLSYNSDGSVTISPTMAYSAGRLDAASILNGPTRAKDNAMAVTAGDFDGDRVDEIALAYLSGPHTLAVEIFRYSVTLDQNNVVQRSLVRVGSTSVTLGSTTYWNETVSLAAGDFDGDFKAELAVGTAEYSGTTQNVKIRLFRVACTDNNICMTSPNVSITLASTNPAVTYTGTTGMKVALAPGLFKVDEPNGFSYSRRQLGVAYNVDNTVYVRTATVGADATQTLDPTLSVAGVDQFVLAAGGFQGTSSTGTMTWSLALATLYNTHWSVRHIRPTPGAAPVAGGTYGGDLTAKPAAPSRIGLTAYDWDNNSMYLGAPVRLTVEDLVRTDYIVQEPPKHAYWDPDYLNDDGTYGSVQTVSRWYSFAVSLENTVGETLENTNKDTMDSSIGGSDSFSAGGTVEAHKKFRLIQTTVSAEASADFSSKVGHDFEKSQTTYNSTSSKRTASFTGKTDGDDFVVARLQAMDIWRYRVYGLDTEDGSNAFYDVIIPGSYQELNTAAGGRMFDWYQPRHENGNILSYPRLADISPTPPDIGTFTIECPKSGEPGYDPACVAKESNSLLLGGQQRYWDSNTFSDTLQFTQESGSGSERSSKATVTESTDFKASAKTSATVGSKKTGASGSFSVSTEFEANKSNSWSQTATANATHTNSTGIALYKPAGFDSQSYAFFPTVYFTADGTLKVTHAVDLYNSRTSGWWRSYYGEFPDLALNLPNRFTPVTSPNNPDIQIGWAPETTSLSKYMRGLFFTQNEIDPLTNDYLPLNEAAVDGQQVRISARIYNYSTGKAAPANIPICFEAIGYIYDENAEETGPRKPIGCTLTPEITALGMATVSVVWDTTGFGPDVAGTEKQYRVYVVIDPLSEQKPCGILEEKYESDRIPSYCYPSRRFIHYCDPHHPADCVDPGQNNEGYAYASVTKSLPADPRWGKPAHVRMNKGSVWAIDRRGELDNRSVQAYLGKPLDIRVTVNSDKPGTQFSHVLLYDNNPDEGGQVIGMKRVFANNIDPKGSSVWMQWTPKKIGPHQLYAKVLQSVHDPAPGDNIASLKVLVIPVPRSPEK